MTPLITEEQLPLSSRMSAESSIAPPAAASPR